MDESRRQATVVLDDSPLHLDAGRAVALSRFPAVAVETSTHRIVAESPSAAAFLNATPSSVLGRLFEDVTDDEPLGVRELFQVGQVTGFEAVTVSSRLIGGVPVRVHLRCLDHQPPSECLLVEFVPEGAADGLADVPLTLERDGMVGAAGTTDESLEVVQLSEGAAPMFGTPAEELVGRSLLSLLAAADRARTLAGVAEAAESGCVITLYVDTHRSREDPDLGSGCELVIVPLRPAPSCFFVFLTTESGLPRARVAEDLVVVLRRLARRVVPALGSSDVVPAVRLAPGQAELTPREREVLALVAAGHRVSAIARALFLSESTVRTHVAATERKLGVTSQHGLRELFSRSPQRPPAAPARLE